MPRLGVKYWWLKKFQSESNNGKFKGMPKATQKTVFWYLENGESDEHHLPLNLIDLSTSYLLCDISKPLKRRPYHISRMAHFRLCDVVVGDGDHEDDSHGKFDIVIGSFGVFIFCMIAIHCFLRRKENKRIKMNLSVVDELWNEGKGVDKGGGAGWNGLWSKRVKKVTI